LVNNTAKTLEARKITKAGRVQTNLVSMPAHTMQCFQLPSSTSKKIDKVNGEFF